MGGSFACVQGRFCAWAIDDLVAMIGLPIARFGSSAAEPRCGGGVARWCQPWTLLTERLALAYPVGNW